MNGIYGKEPNFQIFNAFDADLVKRLLVELRQRKNPHGIIGLFDFYQKEFNNWNDLKTKDWDVFQDDSSKSLILKGENNVFAMLLTVHEKIRPQVISGSQKYCGTYGPASLFTIEHMFFGLENFKEDFKHSEEIPGEFYVFKGDKNSFADQLDSQPKETFVNFHPLFERIKQIFDVIKQTKNIIRPTPATHYLHIN